METKDKRLYERPAMTVVELQHGTPMLQVGSRQDYDMTDENPFGGGSSASRGMGSVWDDDW